MSIFELEARQARSNAEAELARQYGLTVRVTGFDHAVTDHLWEKQEKGFHWPEIISAPFGPARLDIAIWVEDELVALAVAVGHGPATIIRHLEANPHSSVLKGQRFWAALEVTANFVTSLGKSEIWWHPSSPEFLNFCVQTIGAKQVGAQCKFIVP